MVSMGILGKGAKSGCAAQPRGQDGGKSAAQPPLAPTLGELASEARLRGRLQWQVWEMYRDCCLCTLSVMTLYSYLRLRTPSQSRLTPCQLSLWESQGAGVARPAQRVRRANPAAQPPSPPKYPLGNFQTKNRSEATLRNGESFDEWGLRYFLHGSRPDGGRCGYRDFLTRAVRREPGCRRRFWR